jgi:hypothetical protein
MYFNEDLTRLQVEELKTELAMFFVARKGNKWMVVGD